MGSSAVQLPPSQPLAFAADSLFRSADICVFLSSHSKTSRGPRHLPLPRLLLQRASRSPQSSPLPARAHLHHPDTVSFS